MAFGVCENGIPLGICFECVISRYHVGRLPISTMIDVDLAWLRYKEIWCQISASVFPKGLEPDGGVSILGRLT